MTTLWKRLAERYGAVFTNQYGAAKGEAWQTWTLEAQGLSVDMIKIGFEKLVASGAEFPPTAPGFVKLCQSTREDHGLPDEMAAYIEVCKNCHWPSKATWSHPAVRVAGSQTGWDNLKKLKEKDSFARFKNKYAYAIVRVMRGDDLGKEVPEALPEKVHVPLTCEENKARMKSMRAQLGV